MAALLAPAQAQNITLDSVVANNYAGFPSLIFTQNGSTGPGAMEAYNFSFGVSAGDGIGAPLVGGSYVGFCVNLFNSDPTTGNSLAIDTSGDVLSYEVGGSGDYWATGTSTKFMAIKNVLYANKDFFSTTDSNTQVYADMAAAFAILTNEIVIDYDGTLGSIDYAAGNNSVTDSAGDPIAGNVLAYYNTMLGQLGTDSSGFNLYAAGTTGITQDMVFFAIPEPSSMGLVSLAGLLVLRRRRNAC